jgi:hypothetical protein
MNWPIYFPEPELPLVHALSSLVVDDRGLQGASFYKTVKFS